MREGTLLFCELQIVRLRKIRIWIEDIRADNNLWVWIIDVSADNNLWVWIKNCRFAHIGCSNVYSQRQCRQANKHSPFFHKTIPLSSNVCRL